MSPAAVIQKLLEKEKQHTIWLRNLEKLGVDFNRAAPDPNFLDLALDLLEVPPDNTTEKPPPTNLFSRDWLTCKFWDDVLNGTIGPYEYVEWVKEEISKI